MLKMARFKKIYRFTVLHHEIKGFPCLLISLRRRPKKEINIGADPGALNAFQGAGSQFKIDALLKTVQDLLISRFQPEFQHNAPGPLQRQTEVLVGKMGGYPGEAIPRQIQRTS